MASSRRREDPEWELLYNSWDKEVLVRSLREFAKLHEAGKLGPNDMGVHPNYGDRIQSLLKRILEPAE